MPTFSEVFGINKSQSELDFVDTSLNRDIPLFIDPYAITQRHDTWSQSCHDLLKYFFQLVVDSIRSGNPDKAKELLLHLKEPNETRLGFSKEHPQGAGIGRFQAEQLYKAISQSSAVRTGFLSSLEECELMVDGISRDKISDLTTNILRKKLEEYTIDQCTLHDLPTQKIALASYFSQDDNMWINDYYKLPIYDNKPILLVPKFIARYSMDYDAGDYYNQYVLAYLQTEHLSASSSLVRTLKNRKKVVYKKDLKAEYPFSKEFLFEFSKKNPDVLAKYRNALGELEKNHREIIVDSKDEAVLADSLIIALDNIPPGSEYASSYHNLMIGIVEFIFFPYLIYPRKEAEIHEGRKRIDIVMENGAKSGIFNRLHEIRKIHYPFVSIECKNYRTEVSNPELDQLAGRFSHDRGWLGILCCRDFENERLFLKRCIDTHKDGRGLIIHLDDNRVRDLLSSIADGNRKELDRKLTAYVDAVHYA